MSETVFKDFKGSVSRPEFEAVLSLAKKEYDDLRRVVKVITDARNKLISNMASRDEELGPEELEIANKISQSVDRLASNQVKKLFGDRLNNSVAIIDFLNRFVPAGHELEYFNLEFLNK